MHSSLFSHSSIEVLKFSMDSVPWFCLFGNGVFFKLFSRALSSSSHHQAGGASPSRRSALKVGEPTFHSIIHYLASVRGSCVSTFRSLTTLPQRDTTAMRRVALPRGEACARFHQQENPRKKVTEVILLPHPLRAQRKLLSKAGSSKCVSF